MHHRTLDERAERRRTRWRRLNRTLSAGVGALALGTGIYLGVTGPATSPVLPAAPAATVVPSAAAGTTTGAATAGGTAGSGATGTTSGAGTTASGGTTSGGTATVPADRGRGGGVDGGGGRIHMAGFDGHHR